MGGGVQSDSFQYSNFLPQTTTTNHYHNRGVNIYYHTNFCSNPTMFQFYHKLYRTFYQNHKFDHKPLPLSPTHPPQHCMYLRKIQVKVLSGLQWFWGVCKDLARILEEEEQEHWHFGSRFLTRTSGAYRSLVLESRCPVTGHPSCQMPNSI